MLPEDNCMRSQDHQDYSQFTISHSRKNKTWHRNESVIKIKYLSDIHSRFYI